MRASTVGKGCPVDTHTTCKQPELRCLNVADAKLRMAVHLQTELYMPVLPAVTTGKELSGRPEQRPEQMRGGVYC